MLRTLRIKNLALVDDLTLELAPGFNAITGETGAGKSILIGALNLTLGQRAERTLLRSGADSCTVEAVFEPGRLGAHFDQFLTGNGLEPCQDGLLVLKRTFTAAGANRQFINGSPATLATLARLGEWLVDIHGPHDHQSLLQPARQLAVLDAFGKLEAPRGQLGALLEKRAALEAEKAALIVDERTCAQQLDLLRFQVREITEARLRPDEEEPLQQEHRRAANAARLIELARTAQDLLAESDDSLLGRAGALGRCLHDLLKLDESTAPLFAQHEQAAATLRELQHELSRYADRLELDPARLRELEDRLNLLQSLKRKYGASLAEVIAFGDDAQRRLRQLEQRDAELSRLNSELNRLDAGLLQTARELSTRRRRLVPGLCKAVAKHLNDLGFRQSRFEITLTESAPVTATGLDRIEFQFAPNVGEPPRPLRAIASSGELARVMLALKTVLAAEDEVPVLVFDEVDANVGGETAPVLGEKMRRIAAQHQVLCITHLAPVAAAAATHLVVAKQVRNGRSLTTIQRLDGPQRVTELARMLGGQTAAARKHAAALLKDVTPA